MVFGVSSDRWIATSERPSTRMFGTVERIRKWSVALRVAGKRRGLSLQKRTRLLDRDGHLLAEGSAIAGLLVPSETVLIKYAGDDDAGDQALEIGAFRAETHQCVNPYTR